MNTFNHLIAKHGVLASFSIAKRVSLNDIKKLKLKIKKKASRTSKAEYNQLLKEEIIKHTNADIEAKKIPGLISYEDSNVQTHSFKADEQKLMQLNQLAQTIAKKFTDHKFSKDEICYLILGMLNLLGLNDQDFKSFHKKYGDPSSMDGEFDGEDDDEDGELQ